MNLNILTVITLFRIILIPFFIISFYLPFTWSNFITMLIFGIASVTDWFDDYLARKWNQSTPFEAFLDPVADKIMVITALFLVIEHHHSFWFTFPAIIIAREIVISALREWMAELQATKKVSIMWLGKVKTYDSNVSLGGLLWRQSLAMEILAIIML